MEVLVLSHHATIEVDKAALFKSLEQGILAFEKGFPLEDFKKGNYGQHPLITLLTCADSRIPVNIFGDIFNRIFSVENIGNLVKTNEGSVLYGLLHLHTPLMIVAGAGSGKTKVLTTRIAHLMANGVDAFHILALTLPIKPPKK